MKPAHGISLRSDHPTIIDRIRHLFNTNNEPRSLSQVARDLRTNIQSVRTTILYHRSEFHVEKIETLQVRLLDENDASCYNEFVDRFERPVKF